MSAVVDKMTAVAYKFIWILLHYAYTLVRMIQWLSKWVHDRFLSTHPPQVTQSIDSDRKLIEDHIGYMKKMPKHLCVNVGIDEPNYAVLARIIHWALAAGIGIISFYDYRGIIKEHHQQLSEQMGHLKKHNEQLTWEHTKSGECYGSVNYRNGLRKSIKVHVHDASDGKLKIAAICKRICEQKDIQANQLTVDSLDKIIQLQYGNLPDPELCYCIGEFFCTFGMPPWQLRLTEFYKVSDQRSLDVNAFLNGLSIYAKCEQRFGR